MRQAGHKTFYQVAGTTHTHNEYLVPGTAVLLFNTWYLVLFIPDTSLFSPIEIIFVITHPVLWLQTGFQGIELRNVINEG